MNNTMYIFPDTLEQFIKEKYPKDSKKKTEALLYIHEFIEWLKKRYEGRDTVC